MAKYQPKTDFYIKDEEDLRSRFAATHPLAIKKCQSHLDQHSRDFISRSSFICIGTQNEVGMADVSPRGDPSGFVKMLDDQTIAIPDRPGNNRLDSLVNITSNPAIGLLFIIPGFDDTLRINGKAHLSYDPDLLATMAVKDRTPSLAILVSVNEVFIHCAKAFRRSKLWDPSSIQDRDSFPSLSKVILDQTTGAPENLEQMNKIDQDLESEYSQTMY